MTWLRSADATKYPLLHWQHWSTLLRSAGLPEGQTWKADPEVAG